MLVDTKRVCFHIVETVIGCRCFVGSTEWVSAWGMTTGKSCDLEQCTLCGHSNSWRVNLDTDQGPIMGFCTTVSIHPSGNTDQGVELCCEYLSVKLECGMKVSAKPCA